MTTSKKSEKFMFFAGQVIDHIDNYVIPQYGDDGEDLASDYSEEDCVKQAQRYLARHGKNSRPGQESRDLFKAAHWIQMAHTRMEAKMMSPEEAKNNES